MRKLLIVLISAVLLLLILVFFRSGRNGDNCSVSSDNCSVIGVRLFPTSAPLRVGDTLDLLVSVQPADADNRNVNWSTTSADIATIENGIVIGISQGIATITATTQDCNHTATSKIDVYEILPNFCNTRIPRWGESLGVVSFYTDNEWTIEGNGIFQIWSDAVTATACQKTAFAGATSWFPNLSFNADCRSNPDFPGDLFSWCAVVRFADQLCPPAQGWRVPTMQDFIDLDIAMGGTGSTRFLSTENIQFIQDNYITRWGGRFGGSTEGKSYEEEDHGWVGTYWSQTEINAASGHILTLDVRGAMCPRNAWNKNGGFTLRCVR